MVFDNVNIIQSELTFYNTFVNMLCIFVYKTKMVSQEIPTSSLCLCFSAIRNLISMANYLSMLSIMCTLISIQFVNEVSNFGIVEKVPGM